MSFDDVSRQAINHLGCFLGIASIRTGAKAIAITKLKEWVTLPQETVACKNTPWDYHRLCEHPYLVDALYMKVHPRIQDDIVFGLNRRKRWLEAQSAHLLLSECFSMPEGPRLVGLQKFIASFTKMVGYHIVSLGAHGPSKLVLQLAVAVFPNNARALPLAIDLAILRDNARHNNALKYFEPEVAEVIAADIISFTSMPTNFALWHGRQHFIGHLNAIAYQIMPKQRIAIHPQQPRTDNTGIWWRSANKTGREINPLTHVSVISAANAVLLHAETNARWIDPDPYEFEVSHANVLCYQKGIKNFYMLSKEAIDQLAADSLNDREITCLFLSEIHPSAEQLVRDYFCIPDTTDLYIGIERARDTNESALDKLNKYLDDCFVTEEYRKHKVVLETFISKFHTITDGDEKECPICMEESDDVIIKLDCTHTFHWECVLQWINPSKCARYVIKNTCPVCRAQILPLGPQPPL